MYNLNTFVSEDKQKDAKTVSYSYFVIFASVIASQSASRSKETAEAILVVCIWGPVCTKGCHSDHCLREEETREKEVQ